MMPPRSQEKPCPPVESSAARVSPAAVILFRVAERRPNRKEILATTSSGEGLFAARQIVIPQKVQFLTNFAFYFRS